MRIKKFVFTVMPFVSRDQLSDGRSNRTSIGWGVTVELNNGTVNQYGDFVIEDQTSISLMTLDRALNVIMDQARQVLRKLSSEGK